MAKIKNGLFSLGASGTIGRLLTFHQHNTAPIARRAPRNTTPPSTAQAHYRAQCAAAAASWRALDSSKKIEWHAVAAISGANVFAKYLTEWLAQKSTPSQPPFTPMR